MNRRLALFGFVAVPMAVLAARGTAYSAEPAVYTGLVPGVGAGGHDPVAYFTEARSLPGDASISATHQGIAYRFASEANRQAFIAAPERYLPQYGGYCAWAVANGYTAKGDPDAWTVVDGKLYLNYSRSIRSRWERDVPGNIVKGDANWPKVVE